MEKNYHITTLPKDHVYDCLVILTTCNSPLYYTNKIAKDLPKTCKRVLVDEFLHSGNNTERFIGFDFDGSELSHAEFIPVKKHDVARKLTCDYLKENNLLEGITITSVQRRMIEKGLVI